MVVAQLVERSLPTSEIRVNPDIGKIFYTRISTNGNKIEKAKIKEKRPGMAHLKKNTGNSALFILFYNGRNQGQKNCGQYTLKARLTPCSVAEFNSPSANVPVEIQ